HGAYHFALPDRSTGAAQADFFLGHGGGPAAGGSTLPPVIDMEDKPYGPTCYGMTHGPMAPPGADFSPPGRKPTQRRPRGSTPRDWWSRCAGAATGVVRNDSLWLARYNSSAGILPTGWSFYSVWQYNDAGKFPGDQDVFSGTLAQLRAFAGGHRVVLHNPPPPPPTRTPAPP